MIERHEVQQLKEYNESKMKFPCLGQVKMDGIFGRWDPIEKAFFTRPNAVTKKQTRIRGLGILEREMAHHTVPFDGELVIPGQNFYTMNGDIRSFNETPNCVYYVFDRPEDKGYAQRHAAYFDQVTNTHVQPIKVHVLHNQEAADSFYQKVLTAKHEGVVYKSVDALYRHGKHWENMKRVPIKTCECKVVCAYEGLGKLKGMLGGFVVDFNGVSVKVGGGPGIDMAARKEMWDNQDAYLGQLMKCQYKKLTNHGSMRSPQMLGIRWDI